MSQSEVLAVMIRNPSKWWTIEELCKEIKITSKCSIENNCRTMFKHGELDREFEHLDYRRRGHYRKLMLYRINKDYYNRLVKQGVVEDGTIRNS